MSYTSSELDALRLKLVQLIDQINTLQVQLHHASLSTPEPSTSNPGILPWSDLLARYNLLLSQVVGLGSLLSSVGEERKTGEAKDRKRDKWEGSAVAPAVEVEESKDWIVGMLLRTKQVRLRGGAESRSLCGWCRRLKSKRTSLISSSPFLPPLPIPRRTKRPSRHICSLRKQLRCG